VQALEDDEEERRLVRDVARGNLARVLCPHERPLEGLLRTAEGSAHGVSNLLVRARELDGGVAQQAPAMRPVRRGLGRLEQGAPDILQDRSWFLEGLQGAQYTRGVALQRAEEQPALVAEQGVEAAPLEGERVGEVLHRRARVAARPEQLCGATDDRLLLEVPGPAGARHEVTVRSITPILKVVVA
jgi:hypothetical protein